MAVIAVVDDDEDMRMLVEFALTRLGHDVHQACDGLAGLELCQTLHPDLAVVDVNMPVMSGLELVATLRASVEHRSLPVLLVTALAEREDIATGLRAGATAYVTKPFSPRALGEQVEELLSRRHGLAG